MDQRKILELLTEASRESCNHRRLNQIQVLLTDETASRRDGCPAPHNSPEAGFELTLGQLFNDTSNNAPGLLPTLFPFFAMICGDRKKGHLCTYVDWSLVQKQES